VGSIADVNQAIGVGAVQRAVAVTRHRHLIRVCDLINKGGKGRPESFCLGSPSIETV